MNIAQRSHERSEQNLIVGFTPLANVVLQTEFYAIYEIKYKSNFFIHNFPIK